MLVPITIIKNGMSMFRDGKFGAFEMVPEKNGRTYKCFQSGRNTWISSANEWQH